MMQTFDESMKVGDIVTVNPLTARVFHEKAIDFCCGGGISLRQACERKNLNAEDLLTELQSIEQGHGEFEVRDDTPASEIINYILRRFHDTLKQELPAVSFLMTKVARVHGDHHPFLMDLEKKFEALAADIEPHLMKEERILFPLIQKYEECALNGSRPEANHCGTVANPIRQMEHEHETVGDLLKEMRIITEEYSLPAGACNSFHALYAGLEKLEYDLYLHIHMENNVLHPLAVKLEEQVGPGSGIAD